jgi:DDE superfamily endonuclease
MSTLAPAQGEMTSLILPLADTAMMTLFLEHVSQTYSKFFIVMRVDGAGWHHSDELVLPSNMRLITQPAYSPEVNPVEHVWDDMREKYVGNRAFPSLDALIEVLCQALNELADDPKHLRSLTGFPHLLNVKL